jgi:type II secretory pathway pseudopilin PulG
MRKHEAGFSVIEVTVVAGVAMITMGLAAPSIITAIDSYKFNSEVQTVAATIRSARYKAVSNNVTLRLRFNCPATGQMRVVEWTSDPTIDDATDRCDTTAYPYPDPDASTAPNNDGPVIQMSSAVDLPTTVHGLEISTAGRIQPLTGCPSCSVGSPPAVLVMGDDRTSTDRNITVTATGGTTIARYGTPRTEAP